MGDLVLVQQAAQGFHALALGVVFGVQGFGGGIERRHVEGLPFALQRLAAAGEVDGLAVEVIQARAFDFGGTGGFRGATGMRVPARLPVGQPGLGAALLLGGVVLHLLQRFQPRLALGQRRAQGLDLFLVGADVALQFLELALGLALGAGQPLGGFAVVPYLLLDAGDLGADLVHIGLHRIQMLAGAVMGIADAFELRFHLPLLGQVAFDFQFRLAQRIALAFALALQRAVFERAHLGLAAVLLFLQRLPALGRAGLAVQVVELLVDLVAHVLHAVEVLAGGLDPAFGFLAALLVLGDAGGFLQVGAQFVRVGFDDLADHALLDDRVAARSQARTQEKIGDIAAAAASAVQEIRRLPVAADHALDGDLRVLRELALDGAVGVVEDQFHHGLADRLSRRGA